MPQTITVILSRVVEEETVLDVEDMDDAKQKIESLTNDDFWDLDKHYCVQVFDTEGNDLTPKIQPNMRHISM